MALRVLRRGAGAALRGVRARGCEARDVPPCPPCVRAAPPACRARPVAVRRAERRVCCAPPQGSRPPCAPRDPPCSLTCEHSQLKDHKTSINRGRIDVSILATKTCQCELDPVARRIMLAKKVRQAKYEREVMIRASKVRCGPTPAMPGFSLGAERECARATDGCTYAVRSSPAPRTRCGPGRTPPPPRYQELAPDAGCRIRGDAHLDPCAHRPRVMIEIDRSLNTNSRREQPPAPPCQPSPGPGPSARPGPPCCPSPSSQLPRWCADPPRPAPSPPRCRRPNIVERLRARSAPCPREPRCERRLHTSAFLSKASKTATSKSGGLEAMLQNKKSLKAAGVGRFVKDECGQAAPAPKPAPAGKLEVCVPPGTERVAVHVSLLGARAHSCINTCASSSLPGTSLAATRAGEASNLCSKPTGTCDKQKNWLSIKNLHKKISGCRKDEDPVSRVPLAGRCAGPRRRSPAPRSGSPAPSEPRGPQSCSSTAAYLANTIIVDSF